VANTVSVYVPGITVVAALTVTIELPPEVSVAGLNAVVTPGGRFVALSVTGCGDPAVVVVEIA
jgi:hypothetical protein